MLICVKPGQLRQSTSHDHLNQFVGIAFDQNMTFSVVWAATFRCTLMDIVFSEQFNLTRDFAESFIRDMLNGLLFLHETCQMAHGQLNPNTCLITQYWSLKLSDFGLNQVMAELAAGSMLTVELPDCVDGEECPLYELHDLQ